MKKMFLELFYWNFTKKVYFVVLKMKLCMGYLSQHAELFTAAVYEGNMLAKFNCK